MASPRRHRLPPRPVPSRRQRRAVRSVGRPVAPADDHLRPLDPRQSRWPTSSTSIATPDRASSRPATSAAMAPSARRPHQRPDPRRRLRQASSHAGRAERDADAHDRSLKPSRPRKTSHEQDVSGSPRAALLPPDPHHRRSRPRRCSAKARRAAGRRRSSRRIRSTPSSPCIPMRASPAMAASFTDGRLVEAGLKVLRAALCGRERARARARHREAAPEHLLDGPRRHAHPHDQRHRHRAVGHSRQGDRPAGRPAARRRLPRARAALLLAADGGARRACATSSPSIASQRLPRLQDRLGAVRPRAGRASSTRRSSAPRARRPAPDAKLLVDAGASDAYWPHGLKWAMRTAEMLKDYDVGWFEEALQARRHRRFLPPAPRQPRADRRRRGADAPPGLPALARRAAPSTSCSPTSPRSAASASSAASPGWPTISASNISATAGTPRSASPPTCSSPPRCRDADLVEFIGGSPYVDGILAEPFELDSEGYLAIPEKPGLGVTLDLDKLARYTPDISVLRG